MSGPQQVALAGKASARGILSEGRVMLSKCRQLELPEIAFEQGVVLWHDVLLIQMRSTIVHTDVS